MSLTTHLRSTRDAQLKLLQFESVDIWYLRASKPHILSKGYTRDTWSYPWVVTRFSSF